MFDAAQTNATNATGAAPFPMPNASISYQCAHTDATAQAVVARPIKTYSRYGEDLIVESLLAARFELAGRSLGGVLYIEIGVAHPVSSSNTHLFYDKHSAAGVLVTENAGLIDDLCRIRPRDAVLAVNVAADAGATKLDIIGLFARNASQPVDFLAINQEAIQLEVLEELDFALYRPFVIQCRPRARITDRVRRRGSCGFCRKTAMPWLRAPQRR